MGRSVLERVFGMDVVRAVSCWEPPRPLQKRQNRKQGAEGTLKALLFLKGSIWQQRLQPVFRLMGVFAENVHRGPSAETPASITHSIH